MNGLIYTLSVYLDAMAGKWDALVLGDYNAVMPLPYRIKFGIKYIYPPAFTQQLGVTFRLIHDADLANKFLLNIPSSFRYIEMNMNADNAIKMSQTERKNYLLDITANYEKLKTGYSRSAIRNINKAVSNCIQLKKNIPADEIIGIHRNRYKDNIGVKKNDYDNLLSLCVFFKQMGSLYTSGAYHEGKLIAGSIFFVFKNRITFIINGNTKESLNNGATHLLMDDVIKQYCAQDYILDFEGSDYPAFARFYEQYGAQPEKYSFIKLNRLPWPLNLLKR